jgi:hypothetical protein
MRVSLLASLFLAAVATVTAASHKNGPCTGKDGVQGVCISTKSCTNAGGAYIANKCPGLPDDIKCCTKPSCQKAAQKGDCRFVDKCGSGKTTLSGLCPGPDSFKCCVPKTGSTPPKPNPTLNLGQKILKKAQEQKGVPCKKDATFARARLTRVDHWAGGSCKGKTGGGFDCSGLVSWAVCQVTGRDLFKEGLRVTRSMYCASEYVLIFSVSVTFAYMVQEEIEIQVRR